MGNFGVIICRHCRNAIGVNLDHDKPACPRCGKTNRTKSMIKYFKTPNEKELAAAVAEANMKLHLEE